VQSPSASACNESESAACISKGYQVIDQVLISVRKESESPQQKVESENSQENSKSAQRKGDWREWAEQRGFQQREGEKTFDFMIRVTRARRDDEARKRAAA
jgi:hypothetical protein